MTSRKHSDSEHEDEENPAKRFRSDALSEQLYPIYPQMLSSTHLQIQMINIIAENLLKEYGSPNKKFKTYKQAISDDKVILCKSTWNKKHDKLKQMYGNDIEVVDLTSGPFEIFNTRYVWGGIPVPFSSPDNFYSMSFDRIWEGLKVHDNRDPDISILTNRKPPSLQSHEVVTGWWRGPNGKNQPLLNVQEAHWYLTMLPYKKHIESLVCKKMLREVKEKYDKGSRLILIDKRVNSDFNSPYLLSGAFLLQLYLEGKYPKGPVNSG